MSGNEGGRLDAEREGVTLAEWIRRAMRVRLGWFEVIDGNVCNHTRRETVDGVQSCLGCGALIDQALERRQ